MPSGSTASTSSSVAVGRQHVHLDAALGHPLRRHRLDPEVERDDGEAASRRRPERRSGSAVVTSAARSAPAIGGAARDPSSSGSAVELGRGEIPTRIAPRSRRCRVSARVSMPLIPTTPCAVSSSSRLSLRAPRARSALLANQRWLDRHFLPSLFLPRRRYVLIETRCASGLPRPASRSPSSCGRRVGRLISAPARVVSRPSRPSWRSAASELVLRRVHLRAAEWLGPTKSRAVGPIPGSAGRSCRRAPATAPSAGASSTTRSIRRAIASAVSTSRSDPERPTIVFVGESVMFGEGLTWEESVPAQVGAMMGIQSANLAVHGYSTDQAYLRLETELPRFRRPVAVVSLFMTALFGRNLDDDRPHLGPGLVWLPGGTARAAGVARPLLVPYRSDETVERGITVTREVFGATVEAGACARGDAAHRRAAFRRRGEAERTLRRRILDETGLPYVWIEIDEAWRLPWDRHPNARAAHTIATAVAARLRERWRSFASDRRQNS